MDGWQNAMGESKISFVLIPFFFFFVLSTCWFGGSKLKLTCSLLKLILQHEDIRKVYIYEIQVLNQQYKYMNGRNLCTEKILS